MMKLKVKFTPGAGSSGTKDDEENVTTITLGTAKLKINEQQHEATFEVDSTKLPAHPYRSEPEPINVGPDDPVDLQQVFHKVDSTEGLINNVVKMYDALLTKGHEREAAAMQSQIDNGFMPEVVVFTGVMEEYAAAGRTVDVLKVYQRLLDSGANPNTYTYKVLIRALAGDPDPNYLEDAKKYLREMVDVGLKPDAATYVVVFKAYAMRDRVAEAKRFMEEMKAKGFVAEEREVREVLQGRRGRLVKSVINILFGK